MKEDLFINNICLFFFDIYNVIGYLTYLIINHII